MSRVIPDDVWGTLTVWCEARGESFAGKVAVARVIRNRVARRWGGAQTVAEVVLAPYQFSAWNTPDVNRRRAALLDDEDPEYLDCRAAWRMSETSDGGVGGAVFYYNSSYNLSQPPTWALPEKRIATVGQHEFFEA